MTSDQSPNLENLNPVEVVTSDLESSFSLTASAGCGKTHVLVHRVIALLKSGTSLERLLLLTFTENAASEMRRRLALELSNHQEEKWAIDALRSLPYSSIQTLNSFAFDLCSTFFLEATLAVQPKILDEYELTILRKRSFANFYDIAADDLKFSAFFRASRALEINRNKWRNISSSIQRHLPLGMEAGSADFEYLNRDLLNSARKLGESSLQLSFQALECITDIDVSEMGKSPAKRIDAINRFLERIVEADDPMGVLQVISKRSKYVTDSRYRSDPTGDESFEQTFSDLRETIDKDLPIIIDKVLSLGAKWLIEFDQQFRRERFDLGNITHDESLSLAAQVLKNESIKFDVWNRFDSILVDEFQDTDDIQISIIEALTENDGQENVGRLFVVGDSKQSIYGFRGAQVKSYEQFISKSEAKIIPLEKSYRSVGGVLENVNIIMSNLLSSYRPMQNVRASYDQEGAHVLLLGNNTTETTDQVRENQASEIIKSIPQFLEKDIETLQGSSRKAQLSDIAILVRAGTGVPELIKSCEQYNVAYQVDSSDLIWELTITRMILSLINAITDPRDHVSIVGALKSPLFACNNNDLYIHSQKCKFDFDAKSAEEQKTIEKSQSIWNYTSGVAQQAETKVSDSFKILDSLNKKYQSLSPISLVSYLLFERGLLDTFNSISSAKFDSIARFIQSLAIYFEESNSPNTCRDFGKYLSDISKSHKSPIKFIPDDNTDSIRIMTIHKSKGLEFPIVFLAPSVTEVTKLDPASFYLKETDNFSPDSIALYFKKELRDSRLDETLENQALERIEEEIRLLYVGMTRAKDYLILCTHDKAESTSKTAKKDKTPSGGVKLLKQALIETGLFESLPRLNHDENSIKLNSKPISKNISREILELPIEKTSLIHDAFEESSVLSPSILGDSDLENEVEFESSDDSGSPRIEITKPRYSNLVGTATHRALNLVPFNAELEQIEQISYLCAKREGISDRYKQVAELVENALQCREIVNAENYLREVPVSGKIQSHYVEGYIDLLIETPNGWLIVDYKTDSIDAKFSIESKVEKYAPQMAAYAFLLSKVHNLPVAGAALLFLKTKTPDLVFIENLPDLE